GVWGPPPHEAGRAGFFEHVRRARARRYGGLVDGATLDRRSTGRHADQNARSAKTQYGFGARDELAQHLLGSDEVGDDPVAHGADDLDRLWRLAQHGLGPQAHGEHHALAPAHLHRDHGRLIDDDAAPHHTH